MIKIISLRASDGGGAMRIDIKRDGEEKSEAFYILSSHFREYEFSKGEYPAEAYDVLLRLDAVCRGVKCGRRILGYGANSASALRMKLIGKGIKPENLGTLDSFATIAATVSDIFGLDYTAEAGISLKDKV